MYRALLLLSLVACSAADPTQAAGAIGNTTPTTTKTAPTTTPTPTAVEVRPGIEAPTGAQHPLGVVDPITPKKVIGEKGSRGLIGEKG